MRIKLKFGESNTGEGNPLSFGTLKPMIQCLLERAKEKLLGVYVELLLMGIFCLWKETMLYIFPFFFYLKQIKNWQGSF